MSRPTFVTHGALAAICAFFVGCSTDASPAADPAPSPTASSPGPSTASTPAATPTTDPVTPTPPAPPSPPEQEIAVDNSVEGSASKESSFSSEQWNSAVGLGGGSGSRYGGKAGGRAAADADSYARPPASGYFEVADVARSTFGADVDTASFTNVRRLLVAGHLPPPAAVRVEEFVNAQRYGDPAPVGREPFAVAGEVGICPWQPEHQLVRLSLRTAPIAADKLPPCNLVFLVDVSGSMRARNKLPLFQQAIGLLIDQLRPQDHVAIVTYASGVAVPLPSARGDERQRIRAAVQALQAGGSTDGAGGIQRAYEIARAHRVAGTNRVLLATDGDFNVGIRSPDELEAFVTTQKQDGIFLTVLGFGSGNLKDDRLERLADRGDGVYAYVDRLGEARRVLVEQFGASMMTVAKDVKLQVEFDPRQVRRYRLLGYENRALAAAEFRDDTKDAGEMGAGHAVTALYEIERATSAAAEADTLLTLRVRYLPPEGVHAREFSRRLAAPPQVTERPSDDFHVAATAAALALQLQQDADCGSLSFARIDELARALPPHAAELRDVAARACELAAVAASTGR